MPKPARQEAVYRQLLGPAWRQIRAQEIGNARRPAPADVDPVTRRTAAYFRRCAAGEDGLAAARSEDPELARAVAAWDQPATRTDLQTLLLGDVPADDIAELLDLPEPVVRLIEAIFFDVRQLLAAPHTIFSQVIAPETAAGRPECAARLQAAYSFGPHAAIRLVRANLQVPIAGGEQFADAAMLLYARVQQAQSLPLDAAHTVELLRLTAEIRLGEQRLQLEREKLQCRMRRWAERMERRTAGRSSSSSASNAECVVAAAETSVPASPV